MAVKKNNMKTIIAKFNSRCHLCGDQIKKGQSMQYNYANKKCTCLVCSQDVPAKDIICEDPGEHYFDNWAANNL